MLIFLILLGVAGAIVMAGYYAGLETALYRCSQVHLRSLAEAGDHRASAALTFSQRLAVMVTTTLIGHNLAVYMATFLLTRHLETEFHHNAEVVATAALTPFCFIFAETLPKRIAHILPAPYLLQTVTLTGLSRRLYAPLGILLGFTGRLLNRILVYFGYHTQDVQGREQLLEYIEASAADEVLSDNQHQMLRRILAVQELSVRDVMIPLQKAFVLPADASCQRAAQRMREMNHNRVCLTDRSGAPTGELVTLNDILRAEANPDQPVQHLARPMILLDSNVGLTKALERMRQTRARIALATGRSGKPVALVTLRDILSSIVGATHL